MVPCSARSCRDVAGSPGRLWRSRQGCGWIPERLPHAMEEPVILVTGATGNTGSELVRLLAEAGAPARALVRSPKKAASIKRLGLETALGDFEQPDTLDAAMAGCDHLFLLSPPNPHQPEQERNAIDAAKRAGVGHVVALSRS